MSMHIDVCIPSVTLALCLQVYYPVRHHLVQHMVSAMQRLGFTPSVTIEQRRLAVDLSEVVIKWELQRIKDQQVDLSPLSVTSTCVPCTTTWKSVS